MGVNLLHSIPEDVAVTVDAAPIIYFLDGHVELAAAYQPLFAAAQSGRNQLLVSTITVAEVLGGPLARRNEVLAERYKHALTRGPGWSVLDVTLDVAEHAARLRARYRLRLPDAIQVATALVSGSHSLVTHDRDFSAIREIPIVTATVG